MEEIVDKVKTVVRITERMCVRPFTLCPTHSQCSQTFLVIITFIMDTYVFKQKAREY